MKKAASVFLRTEIRPRDVSQLIDWLENPRITRYLNEGSDTPDALRRLLDTVPPPLLSLQFNQSGRFFLVCDGGDEAVGFVKLKNQPPSGSYEIVFAVGEESLWGNGYGCGAIRAALSTAFLEWRAREVTARIYAENQRSINAVRSCGFTCAHRGEKLHCYTATSGAYLDRLLHG